MDSTTPTETELPAFMRPEVIEREVSYDNGAQILNWMADYIRYVVVLPSEEHVTAAVLWVLHVHALGARGRNEPPVFDKTPRMVIGGPTPGCGKTVLLRTVSYLCPNSERLLLPKSASLYRALQAAMDAKDEHGVEEIGPPCFFFDEYDCNTKDEDLRAYVDGGWEQGNTVKRCGPAELNFQPINFETFGPLAISGIGRPNATILQRSIFFKMRPCTDEEDKDLDERVVEAAGRALNMKVSLWVTSNMKEVERCASKKLTELSRRTRDVWKPLVTMADVASPKWGKSARKAAEWFAKGSKKINRSRPEDLLIALRDIMRDKLAYPVALACNEIRERDDLDVGEYGTPCAVGRALADFDIESMLARVGADRKTTRCYVNNDDLKAVFERYLGKDPGPGSIFGDPEQRLEVKIGLPEGDKPKLYEAQAQE